MTLDFDEVEATGKLDRYSQVAQLLRAMAAAGADGLPLSVRWERDSRHVIVRGRQKRGGKYPVLLRVYDAEFRRAAAAGFIAAAADPPDGTWLLTQKGRQLVEELK